MKQICPYLAVAVYPFMHTVAAPLFVKYAPEPAPGKSWYAVIYHGIELFAAGNGKGQ